VFSVLATPAPHRDEAGEQVFRGALTTPATQTFYNTGVRAFADALRSPTSVRPERRILGNSPIRSRLGAGRTQFRRWNCVRASAWAIRLIGFITEPGPIRKILVHLGEPLEPPPLSPVRGPPADLGDLVQAHEDRDVSQTSPDELPVIDIHSL